VPRALEEAICAAGFTAQWGGAHHAVLPDPANKKSAPYGDTLMSMRTTHTPKAKDIMTGEPVCAESSTTIRQLARLFEDNDISGCPVVNQEGKVIGVVSKTDLIRRCSEGTAEVPPAYLFEVVCEQAGGDGESDGPPIPEPLVCVQDFMTESAVTARQNAPVHEIATLMVDKHIHRVVVVDNEHFPIGMITTLDVLRFFPRPGP